MSRGWDAAVAEAHRACRNRRARVLAHPDIAQRLCDPPMRYPAPEFWSGYIPPYLAGDRIVNTSPIRRQLIAICQAVQEREAAIAAGEIEAPESMPEEPGPEEEPPPPDEEEPA